MLTAILEKIPVLLAGILLIWSAVKIYIRSKNISRSELIRIFKKAKYINLRVIAVCLACAAVFGLFNHLDAKRSVYAVIYLNYSEASRSLNSNGTRYNMAEIICDDVVKRAIEKGALENVSVKDLKECLSVYPCVQGNALSESDYHISTEFGIEYRASKKTDHLDTENVIKLITAAYKEYYIEKYTDNFCLDNIIDEGDFKDTEYMDTVAFLSKEASSVLNYLYGMAEKAPSFVTSNNTTFNSIAGKLHQFKQTQIEQNLESLVLQNGVAKNKGAYIERLSYQNKNTDFDRRKNAASFDLCNQAIAMYSEEMTRVVLVPTWDKGGKYYMGRTKVGIDELSVKATEYSDNVASNEKEIMDNNLIIGKMSASVPNMSDSADELISSIYDSIKMFEKEAIAAGREYHDYKMNQCIAVSIYGLSFIKLIKNLLLYALLAYAALMLYVISKDMPYKA